MSHVRERLEQDLAKVDWPWLRPHARRDALILVADDLDLVGVGASVAEDDRVRVSAWIGEGRLRKPTPEQVRSWEERPETAFHVLIVQPYVLARPAPRG